MSVLREVAWGCEWLLASLQWLGQANNTQASSLALEAGLHKGLELLLP